MTTFPGFEGSVKAYDVVVERGLTVPARDGVQLATDLYRPARGDRPVAGAFPTIVERTPYDRGRPDLHLTGCYFASRGYTVLFQDCRGRYDSEGEFQAWFNEHHEGLDGYDTVEWAAAQPWSTGRIGTTGQSFCGANQQALAIERPPHLTTQVILDAGYDYWRQMIRLGGAFSAGIIFPLALRLAYTGKEAAADPLVKAELGSAIEHVHEWVQRLPLKRGASPLALAPSYEDWYLYMASQPDYEGRWLNPQASLDAHVAGYPDIPIFLITSWYGHHAAANFEKYARLRAQNAQPLKLLCGAWVHGADFLQAPYAGDVQFGNDMAFGVDEVRLRWFDQFLKGLETGIAGERPISIFAMGGGSGRRVDPGHMMHGGRWREVDAWPLPEAEATAYHLHRDGTLRREAPAADVEPTSYVFDPADPVPTIGGNMQDPPIGGAQVVVAGGAFDQRGQANVAVCRDLLPLSSRPDVLVFRTAPLEEAVEVTGAVEVTLWVSSSCRDTDFTVKLVDEHPPNPDYPGGYAMNVCDSIVRMRHRNGRTHGELIEPGAVYEVTLAPMLTSNVFERGHRIRLDVSSSNFPHFDVNPNTGGPMGVPRGALTALNTLYHDADRPSKVVLPIVPEPSNEEER